MKKKLRLMMTMLLLAVLGSAWGQTGTVVFGNNGIKINAASVSGDDNLNNTWTVTTEGTTSFTPNTSYSQVGSSSQPATSITFKTTLPSSVTITSMEAKFGGFNGTYGDITLKVGGETVGTGSLNVTNDVIVSSSSSASGTVLMVTVTNIAKGVKCYYIKYTIDGVAKPSFSVQSGTYNPPLNVELSCATTDAIIYYTEDGIDPTLNSTQYNNENPIVISSLGEKTIKAIAYKNGKYSEVATATYTIVKKVPNLSYTPTSYTVNLYEGFDSPVLSNPNSLSPITYSSSVESVAKVKADGSVVLFGEGTTVITASFAGNDEYEAGTASYTLTVVKISESKVYRKVTSKNDLEVGKSYVIVYEEGSKAMGAISTTSTPYGTPIDVDKDNGKVSISEDVSELVLGGTEDEYTFHTSDSKFLSWTSGNSLKVVTSVDNNSKWKIVSTEGGYIVKNAYDNSRIIQYNSTSPRFACYTGTQKEAVLYVQESGVEYEEVIFATAGYKTYVTENAIDWTATEAKGVEGIQVTDLSKTSVALQKLGDGLITVANTPVILKGKEGVNLLVIASDDGSDISSTNLLKRGSERKESEKNFMYVLQKSNNWSEENPYDEYNFYPLRPTRWNDIGDRQAYLVLATTPGGGDIGGETGGPGFGVKPIPITFINANDDEPLVSDDAGLVDGINEIQHNEALDGEFYSISGVRVAAPTKGLYIVNGKKVLIK